MRIVYTNGGSGGHVFPVLAVHEKMKLLAKNYTDEDFQIYYIGGNGFGKERFQNEGIHTHIVFAGKLRRYISPKQILDAGKFILGFFQVFWWMWNVMPDVVFSKGGHGSFWTVCIAWFFRIPVLIHESDSRPGLTNRLVSRFAVKIIVSFEDTKKFFPKKQVILLGNPTRDILFTKPAKDAKHTLGISTNKPIVLVLGGSLGAHQINLALLKILPEILVDYEIVHQCGTQNHQATKRETEYLLKNADKNSYHLFPFLRDEQLQAAYAISDLVISRAGGSIYEIARAGKPSILIPLGTSASNHQYFNAFQYTKTGAGVLLEDQNLTPHLFLSKIVSAMKDRELRSKMRVKALAFARPDAAQMIAQEIVNLVKPPKNEIIK